MADYYPLVAKAVAGLHKNTGEGRRALYERARGKLVEQLRGMNDPPLTEAEITRERLALEEAIRKVEPEAARRGRSDAPPPSAPEWPPRPRGRQVTDEGLKGFRDVIAEAEGLGEATAGLALETFARRRAESRSRGTPAAQPRIMATAQAPKIFVSYRRIEDATGWTIARDLKEKYGDNAVFIDADIRPGDNFLEYIRMTVVKSKVLVVIIGNLWYEVLGDGSPKIQQPDDPVRFEIEIALEHGIHIVPVLVQNAKMPTLQQLPKSLLPFVYCNAVFIDITRDFKSHMNTRLIPFLDTFMKGK